MVVDEAIAQTLSRHLVSDQLTALNLTNGRKQGANLLLHRKRNNENNVHMFETLQSTDLCHCLWKIIDYEIGLPVIFCHQVGAGHPILHHL